MGRPAKLIDTNSMKMSKEERKAREEKEAQLRGNNNNLKPLKHLNKRQKQIFKYLLDNLNKEILGNLDTYVLNQTAITFERLETIEKECNEDIALLMNPNFKSVRDMYSKDFFRCCNELSLSPQSRAKLSIASVPPKRKTIMDTLNEDDDDDE